MKKFDSLTEAVKSIFGENAEIKRRQAVGGGDINEAYRLVLSDGHEVFLKSNTLGNFSFFKAEYEGLRALASCGKISVPEVFCAGTDEKLGISFIMMENIESGRKISDYWETFGRSLAMLHRTCAESFVGSDFFGFGFSSDNYIGASPQINTPKSSWTEFFRDCRLYPQFKRAEHYMDRAMRSRCVRLMDHLDSYIDEPEFPSLIHGDLWSGNSLCGPDGRAWIIDPAAYVGHFEAELAMTELFGSNPASFYRAYNEITRIEPEYHERKYIYNLYHLLNHLNLFGVSYLGSVRNILIRY